MFGLIGTTLAHNDTACRYVDKLSYRPVPQTGIVQEYFS